MFIAKDGVRRMAIEKEILLPLWVRFLSDEDRRLYERLKYWMDCALEDMIQMEALLDEIEGPDEMKARVRDRIQEMTRYEVSAADFFIRRIYKDTHPSCKL